MSFSLAWGAALLDELARAGLRDVVISPGSRSAPLALAARSDSRLADHSIVDERSAGFFALGLARVTRRPVALICTSGTATANYLPAVVEASQSRVPLVVLTADRPPELRDCGAPQTIDQLGIYGRAVRWFQDLPTPGPEPALWAHLRRCAARAAADARGPCAGPTHLNVPLREPLSPTPDARPEPEPPRGVEPLTAVTSSLRAPDPATVRSLVEWMGSESAGWLVVGPLDAESELTDAIARLAATTGWALFGEPLSQQRSGSKRSSLHVDAHDAVVRARDFVARHAPRRVLRLGAVPTSKALMTALRGMNAEQWAVDPDGWSDPDARADRLLRCDPLPLVTACADQLETRRAPNRSAFAEHWVRAGQRARASLDRELDELAHLSEPDTVRALAEVIPDRACLYLGNSMPVRDADAFWPAGSRDLRVLGNRGANGIDGTLSTLVGTACGAETPTVGLIGDLALLHDWNGLLAARDLDPNLTVVVVDNAGGGIFEFLPIASDVDRSTFERHFGTDPGVDLSAALAGFGISCSTPESPLALRSALKDAMASKGLQFVLVRTDRRRNALLHAQLVETCVRELSR